MRSVDNPLLPKQIKLRWKSIYRIIASHFPPINFFEHLIQPDLMEDLWALESLTNDRLREDAGDIYRVAKEDWISGPGASVVMAPFTHISKDRVTRFSDGSYGVYYAAKTLETAIFETKYHREQFMRATKEEPGNVSMRAYEAQIQKPLYDIRQRDYISLHHPTNYAPSQQFAANLRTFKAFGLVYNSVRDPSGKGQCIAALRPSALSIPKQTLHLSYVWDGEQISSVYKQTKIDKISLTF